MNLKVNIEKKQEGFYVISLNGSLDNVTYEECDNQVALILGPSTKKIIFDMAGLYYISSIGFTVLIKANRVIKNNSGALAIANLKPDVKRVFATMRMLPDTIFDSIEDAYKYIEGK
ncbi:MAG: STAS domain-containing protein [Candidatus Omnitrophota bacterium]